MKTEPVFDQERSHAIRELLYLTASAEVMDKRSWVDRRFPSRGAKIGASIALIIAGTATAGGAVALTNYGAWIAQPCASPLGCAETFAPVGEWPTNDSGLTYGNQGDSPIPPDLTQVFSTNGKMGYVYSTEITAPDFTSPEEVTAWQEAHQGKSHLVPVYEQDGRTKIGEFEVPW